MARLAMLAMVLLLAVPTVGRIVKAEGATGMSSPLVAVCTVMGMKLVDPATFGAISLAEHPDPQMPMHPGEDCDYCPVLAAAICVFVAIALALLSFGKSDPPRQHQSAFAVFRYPSGLGSRGPPILL